MFHFLRLRLRQVFKKVSFFRKTRAYVVFVLDISSSINIHSSSKMF